jgi:hypothetical protein
MALQPYVRPRTIFKFLNPIHRTKQTQTAFVSRVEFEPTTSLFERAKTDHFLNLADIVIGLLYN